MSTSSTYRHFTLMRGLLNNYDDYYDEEVDFGELDARAFNLRRELDKLQPNRDPQLELEYLGVSGDLELMFNFRITWMDRESDIEEFLEESQEVIENGMDMIVTEKQILGVRKE